MPTLKPKIQLYLCSCFSNFKGGNVNGCTGPEQDISFSMANQKDTKQCAGFRML